MKKNISYPVTCHTDHVGPDSTFVAINGYYQKGTSFIEQAINNGATTIVLENNEALIKQLKATYPKITFTTVNNTRIALAQLSAQAYNYPAKKLKIIGITGTKGKTTTCYLINHILQYCGYRTALLTGIQNSIVNQTFSSSLTTHNSDYLQHFLHSCAQQTVDYVVMEVSSHALSLHRVHGIAYDAIGFTNLDIEHLDFYHTMENYFSAKLQLFDQRKKHAPIVINIDKTTLKIITITC